jgi:hypothetical protein
MMRPSKEAGAQHSLSPVMPRRRSGDVQVCASGDLKRESIRGYLVLESSAIGDLDLRKPSHRPVNILPNARREVSSGLRCPALRPFCFDTQFEPPPPPGELPRLGKRASRVRASVPRLTTRHTVVQRIALLRRRQADLAHNFHKSNATTSRSVPAAPWSK